jgi:hypothetical protein
MSQVLDAHETLGIGSGHANNIYFAFSTKEIRVGMTKLWAIDVSCQRLSTNCTSLTAYNILGWWCWVGIWCNGLKWCQGDGASWFEASHPWLGHVGSSPWGLEWCGEGQFLAKCLSSLKKKCKGRNWPNAHGQCCKPGEEGLNYHHRPRQLVILRFNQLPHLLCTSVFQSLGWILLSPQTLHTNCLLDLWMISENFFEGRFGFLSKNASR